MSAITSYSNLDRNFLGLVLAIFLGSVVLGVIIGSEWISWTLISMVIVAIGYVGVVIRRPHVGLAIYIAVIPWLHIILSNQFSETGLASVGSTFTFLGAVKDILLILFVFGFVINELGQSRRVGIKENKLLIGFWVLYVVTSVIYAIVSPTLLAGMWALRGVLEFSLIFLLAQKVIDNTDKAITLLKVFVLTGLIVGLYSFFQTSIASISSAQQAFGGSRNFVVGAIQFGHRTSRGVYATYIGSVAIVGVCFLLVYRGSRFWQTLMAVTTIVSLFTMILTFERRGVVGLLVAGLLILILTRSFSRWALVAAGLILGLIIFFVIQPQVYTLYANRFNFDPNAAINLKRVSLLGFYWQMAVGDFLLGRGLGTAGNFATSIRGFYEFSPHNYYLLLLVEGGIPLLFAFLATIGKVLIHAFKTCFALPKEEQFVLVTCLAVSTSFLVQAFFSDFLEIFPFNFYLWLFLGIAVSVSQFQSKDLQTE